MFRISAKDTFSTYDYQMNVFHYDHYFQNDHRNHEHSKNEKDKPIHS